MSARGAWQDWLEYFLQRVARMSEDALNRATRINDLLAEWRSKLAGQSANMPLRVVDLLAANPLLTITGAASQMKVAFTTAFADDERREDSRLPYPMPSGSERCMRRLHRADEIRECPKADLVQDGQGVSQVERIHITEVWNRFLLGDCSLNLPAVAGRFIDFQCNLGSSRW